MIEVIKVGEENIVKVLPAYDWRHSAACLGLLRYFEYLGVGVVDVDEVLLDTSLDGLFDKSKVGNLLRRSVVIVDELSTGFEYLMFREALITNQDYLGFVRSVSDDLQHLQARGILQDGLTSDWVFSEEDIKKVNSLLTGLEAPTICKSTFKGYKFDGTGAEELISRIDDFTDVLTYETFKNKKTGYRNYCNTNMFLKKEEQKEGKPSKYARALSCRVESYSLDEGRKLRSASWMFDKKAFEGEDHVIFDFIPFAFIGKYNTVFINANYSLRGMYEVFKEIETQVKGLNISDLVSINDRYQFIQVFMLLSDILGSDCELVVKRIDEGYETVYLRRQQIVHLNRIKQFVGDTSKLIKVLRINSKTMLFLERELLFCVLNGILPKYLIEFYLRVGTQRSLVTMLIGIHQIIENKGRFYSVKREVLDEVLVKGRQVAHKLKENNTAKYRIKMTNALIAKDYNSFCKDLLVLSNLVNSEFEFAYPLFDEYGFEKNIDIAYAFINALDAKAKIDKFVKDEEIESEEV